MNPFTFDELINARASRQVENRIRQFKSDLIKALTVLGVEYVPNFGYGHTFSPTNEGAIVLNVMLSQNTQKGWPVGLWERERVVVAKELLSTMDVMQQAIVAAGRPIEEDRACPGEKS